jgi:hypothetical protein
MGRIRTTTAPAALALAAAVSACSPGEDVTKVGCPQIIRAPGADTIAFFGPKGRTMRDVIIGGKFYNLSVTCEREDVGINVNALIEFYVERANLGIEDTTLPYFVALVGPDGKVVTEEGFTLRVPFIPGESYRRTLPEKITIHLPIRNITSAGGYTVVTGFQLTPDQIAFNRATHPQ